MPNDEQLTRRNNWCRSARYTRWWNMGLSLGYTWTYRAVSKAQIFLVR